MKKAALIVAAVATLAATVVTGPAEARRLHRHGGAIAAVTAATAAAVAAGVAADAYGYGPGYGYYGPAPVYYGAPVYLGGLRPF